MNDQFSMSLLPLIDKIIANIYNLKVPYISKISLVIGTYINMLRMHLSTHDQLLMSLVGNSTFYVVK